MHDRKSNEQPDHGRKARIILETTSSSSLSFQFFSHFGQFLTGAGLILGIAISFIAFGLIGAAAYLYYRDHLKNRGVNTNKLFDLSETNLSSLEKDIQSEREKMLENLLTLQSFLINKKTAIPIEEKKASKEDTEEEELADDEKLFLECINLFCDSKESKDLSIDLNNPALKEAKHAEPIDPPQPSRRSAAYSFVVGFTGTSSTLIGIAQLIMAIVNLLNPMAITSISALVLAIPIAGWIVVGVAVVAGLCIGAYMYSKSLEYAKKDAETAARNECVYALKKDHEEYKKENKQLEKKNKQLEHLKNNTIKNKLEKTNDELKRENDELKRENYALRIKQATNPQSIATLKEHKGDNTPQPLPSSNNPSTLFFDIQSSRNDRLTPTLKRRYSIG
jgi:hypothetical protein